MAELPLREALLASLRLAGNGSFWAGDPGSAALGTWSTLIMDGQVFPGADGPDDRRACAVRLRGGVRYRIDSQKVKGQSGHKLVSEGYEPTQITAEVRIWRPEQWLAFVQYLPFINPKVQGNQRRARGVEHPFLSAYGISTVYVNEIHLPEEAEHRFIRTVRMNLWEVFDIRTGAGDGAKTVKPTDGDYSGGVRQEFRGVEGPEYEAAP